jgi:hypothetical protein
VGLPPLDPAAHTVLIERPDGLFQSIALDGAPEVLVPLGEGFGAATFSAATYADTPEAMWIPTGTVASADPTDPYSVALPSELADFQTTVHQDGSATGWRRAPGPGDALKSFHRLIPSSICDRFHAQQVNVATAAAPMGFLVASSSIALIGIAFGPLFYFDGALHPINTTVSHSCARIDSTGEIWIGTLDGLVLHGHLDIGSGTLVLAPFGDPTPGALYALEVVRSATVTRVFAVASTTIAGGGGRLHPLVSTGGAWTPLHAPLVGLARDSLGTISQTSSSGQALLVLRSDSGLIMLRAENDHAQEEAIPLALGDQLEAFAHVDGLGFVMGSKSGALFADHDGGRWAPLASSLGVTVHSIGSVGARMLIATQFGALYTSLIEYAPQLASLFCPERFMVPTFNPMHVARLGDRWLVGGIAVNSSSTAADSILLVLSSGG